MEINKREAIRYLGYGKSVPDAATMELIDACMEEIEECAVPKYVCKRMDAQIMEATCVRVEGLEMQSKQLAKNLKGCQEVIFFAATLGIEVDRRLHRYLRLQISKAAVFQAVAAAAMEAYCNEVQQELGRQIEKEGLYLRPRYSPGYGDLSLSIQGAFLQVLGATKQIGITLSDGDIMLPEKSVTAIIGISAENSKCHIQGCEACGKVDCPYQRA